MAVFSGSEPALKLCRPHSMTATATRAGSNTERTKLAAPSERAINKTAEGQTQPKKKKSRRRKTRRPSLRGHFFIEIQAPTERTDYAAESLKIINELNQIPGEIDRFNRCVYDSDKAKRDE